MTTLYDTTKIELVRLITSQKNIYKFRVFIYSLNKDIRQRCFELTRQYLQNEYTNNEAISITEKERLRILLGHWEWNNFDNNATNWWSALSFNHSISTTLMTIIHIWIDDISEFDSEAFETSTLGLR